VASAWTISPFDAEAAHRLVADLDVSEVTASVLVRRGYDEPDSARRFLAAELPGHDPHLLGDMAEAVERIRTAVTNGKKICVHGDYDVDGICATALAIVVLREAGAEATWHLPSRFEEGYGLSSETLERLADQGVDLVLTVDCGITAVDEIAAARRRGVEIIVTDHHRPGENLPDCPIVATRPSSYPFPELCGTGVVYKLGEALLGADHPALRKHLDLVALATVADVVPLVDENRALATAGLRALACTRRPGLQALMRSAHVDPAVVDSSAIGFRLAPRINAAGRLCRPDIALELILTDDAERAKALAAELEDLNRDRQAVEDRIVREAVEIVESWPERQRRRRGYVLWREDWHEGVNGIVASRLVERYHRPIVLISGGVGSTEPTSRRRLDGAGQESESGGFAAAEREQGGGASFAGAEAGTETWKGSGRSIPRFDLHGALAACASHLERFGGHRAAAGLSIDPARLEAFAEAFAAHADAMLTEQDLWPVTVVDAAVNAQDLTLELAQELDRLAPFGLGNPDVMLLVPGCSPVEPTTVGDGKHLRFRVRQNGTDAGTAIAFGQGGQIDRLRAVGHFDIAFRLKENHWNGTVAPQLVVRRLFDTPESYLELRDTLAVLWRDEAAWTEDVRRIFDELGLAAGHTSRKKQLLESETFRALLEQESLEPLPLAEAA
jgi:single-stranded-DNA-specific exonuclease